MIYTLSYVVEVSITSWIQRSLITASLAHKFNLILKSMSDFLMLLYHIALFLLVLFLKYVFLGFDVHHLHLITTCFFYWVTCRAILLILRAGKVSLGSHEKSLCSPDFLPQCDLLLGFAKGWNYRHESLCLGLLESYLIFGRSWSCI